MNEREAIRARWATKHPDRAGQMYVDIAFLLDALDEAERTSAAWESGYRAWRNNAGVAEARLEDATALLREVLDGYVDACWQGSGNEPLATPTWHNFISTYEDADELIPRARVFLEGDPHVG